jgi:REP element-mobilizing transposase RayT
LYRNKYRVDTARLAHFDYSSPGEYFVTICTEDKICYFGAIANGEMRVSTVGSVVLGEWQQTARVRENVELDAFVVMPNHIHGIIVIKNSLVETIGPIVSHAEETTHRKIETTHRVVSTRNKSKTLQPNSLGSIVGQFKSVCTKRIRAAGFHDFAWQPGYYDHVIRDEKDLERIREYIMMNPSRWDLDDEFAHNIGIDPIHAG